ncbi:MAG: hypothetical protein ACRCZP_16795 [Phycicoccus sp.]
MSLDLLAVADRLAEALRAVDGLNVWSYPPDALVAPGAFVSLPDRVEYADTYGDGCVAETVSLYVHLAVPLGSPRAAQAALLPYLAAEGAKSVWAALDAHDFGDVDVRVRSADTVQQTYAAIPYLFASFLIEITGG